MATAPAARGGLFKVLRPGMRPQSTDITAAVGWGIAAAAAALWLVQIEVGEEVRQTNARIQHIQRKLIEVGEDDRQTNARIQHTQRKFVAMNYLPFDWLKKQFFEKPEPKQ